VGIFATACGSVSESNVDAGDPIDAASDALDITPATIAELRAAADGPVNALLEGVVVTYVQANGFFVQLDRTGPGLQVFTANAGVDVSIGNRVDLHVTNMATFMGNKQIDAHTVVENDGGNLDVLVNLAQDVVAAGQVLGEDLEGELAVAGVAFVNPIQVGVSYLVEYNLGGAPQQVSLFHPFAGVLDTCAVGAPIRIERSVITEFNGQHQFNAANAGEVVVADPLMCP